MFLLGQIRPIEEGMGKRGRAMRAARQGGSLGERQPTRRGCVRGTIDASS
jgi:hypothetical protein